jgi:hypothetical protein
MNYDNEDYDDGAKMPEYRYLCGVPRDHMDEREIEIRDDLREYFNQDDNEQRFEE